MQSIAKEMNLSETTFILPAMPPSSASGASACASSRCRKSCRSPVIPRWARHLPCAAKSGAEEKVVLELNVGKVPVHFEDKNGQPAFGEMTQIDPTFGDAA
jgi:predicted PhzF superfamily epimerase YddE/YHI9